MPENTKPTVYYLGKFGRKLLQKHFSETERDDRKGILLSQLQKTYKDSQRTTVYRMTCMALVDSAIATTAYYADKKEYSMRLFSITQCQTFANTDKFETFLILEKKSNKKKRYGILYITNRTIRRFIRYRISEIITYLSEEWREKFEIPLPTILCICSNLPIRNYAKKICEAKLEYYAPDEKMHMRLTTLNEFKQYAFDTHHWKQPNVPQEDSLD